MSVLMRSFEGKSILSLIRSGDYAHAGEEEAITKVFKHTTKKTSRKILDVGCGRGGTASFVQRHEFGSVTGIDIEPESIEFAQLTYPEIDFYCTDVINVGNIFAEKFDLIYIFNAFYEFSQQLKSLQALRKVAHETTSLIIFDYIDLSNGLSSIIIRNDPKKITQPIEPTSFNAMASTTGWHQESYEDLSEEYKIWYQYLLKKIEEKRNEIIVHFGQEGYYSAKKRYRTLLTAINNNDITGGIIRLTASPL